MGVLDFLFEGQPPPTVSTTQQQNQSLPPFAQQYLEGLMSRANAVAGQPYTPYGGPRVADVTPNMQTAWNTLSENPNVGGAAFETGRGALTAATQPFNQGTFEQFKSPYIEGVVNRIGDLGARNLSERLLPAVNETFTGAGMFGGDRHADFTARALRDQGESTLGQQALALQQAQDSAMGAYNTAMGRTGTAGAGLGQIGALSTDALVKNAAAVEAAGQSQRGIGQQSLDVAYQDFLNQRDWNKSNVDFMNTAIRGIPNPGSVVNTTSAAPAPYMSPSPLAQLAGGIGTIAALSGAKLKKGGRVNRRRSRRSALLTMMG